MQSLDSLAAPVAAEGAARGESRRETSPNEEVQDRNVVEHRRLLGEEGRNLHLAQERLSEALRDAQERSFMIASSRAGDNGGSTGGRNGGRQGGGGGGGGVTYGAAGRGDAASEAAAAREEAASAAAGAEVGSPKSEKVRLWCCDHVTHCSWCCPFLLIR